MPRYKKNQQKQDCKIDLFIQERTKIDASKLNDNTEGKIGVYVPEARGYVYFRKDKPLQEQIDNYIAKLGLTANQLLRLR